MGLTRRQFDKGAIPTMCAKTLKTTAAILISLGAIGMRSAAAQSPGQSPRSRPTASRPEVTHVPAGLPKTADLIYRHVKRQVPNELSWQQIPWAVDLAEAIRQARVEKRPILIWVAGDDPLERC
jgi:hypothetical protein